MRSGVCGEPVHVRRSHAFPSRSTFTLALEIPEAAKEQLLLLSPATYIGNAEAQAHALPSHLATLRR